MKKKLYTAIGLMSGTSMDGVDVSLIRSDGFNEFVNVLDEYFEYDKNLHQQLIELRNLILTIDDLELYTSRLNELERKITVFHSKIVSKISLDYKDEIDFVGFHGQTIFHSPNKNITKQLGDGKLMSQLTKKRVVYDFRQEDILNRGQGAPLTPIFHNLLSKNIIKKNNINFPICFLNIGGISNITKINKNDEDLEINIEAFDAGPGNCMIDEWVRKNSKNNFDANGSIAKSGKVDQLILNQAIDNFKIDSFKTSLDIKDFDISFARGLSLEDGCSTITKYTAYLISEGIKKINKMNEIDISNLCLCGGGRKNKTLIKFIKEYLFEKKLILRNIDDYGFEGDFIESQAFAYLAIRSFLGLPISYPNTTRVSLPVTGGEIKKNY